jgi:hypothetical protein
MSYKSVYGANVNAMKKRVKYIGTSVIYEGMALCYDYNATANILGYDKGAGGHPECQTSPTTTAEGYQNEGKFLLVEDPATANLMWFAGVVAPGNWVGKTGTGSMWLDIYIPNGAIVPVLSYVSSTVGSTALCIQNAVNYLGKPAASTTNGAARYVAVAEETVDRSTTAGLCLARLDPNMFLYQCGASAKLNCATAGTTVDLAPNFINVSSAQTSGGFTALWVRAEVATAGNLDTSLAVYGEANVTGVCAAANCVANRFSLNLWGGTQTAGIITALAAEIYEQDANLTGSTVIAPLWLRTQIDATNAPAAGSHWMIYMNVDGADKPDGFFFAKSLDTIGAYASTGDAPALATGDIMIPVKINATTYYLVAFVDAGV